MSNLIKYRCGAVTTEQESDDLEPTVTNTSTELLKVPPHLK